VAITTYFNTPGILACLRHHDLFHNLCVAAHLVWSITGAQNKIESINIVHKSCKPHCCSFKEIIFPHLISRELNDRTLCVFLCRENFVCEP
jgi:hypothetical protein